MHCAFISPSSDIHLSRKLHGAWNGSRLYEYRTSTSVSHNLPLSSAQDILWSTFDLGSSSHPMPDRTLFIPVAVPRMLSFQEFLLVIPFCLYSTSSALECYSGILPNLAHCQILIRALVDWSRMPGKTTLRNMAEQWRVAYIPRGFQKFFILQVQKTTTVLSLSTWRSLITTLSILSDSKTLLGRLTRSSLCV